MRYRKGAPLISDSPLKRLIGDMLIALIGAIGWPLCRALYHIEIRRAEPVDHRRLPGRAILVSNHCIPLDPLFHGLTILPRRTWYTLLEETCEAPVLGTFVRTLGGIPLPHSRSRLEDIEDAVAHGLRTRGLVHFYPEGECFLGNQKIFPFKAGAAYFAIRFGVPVVPIVTVLRRLHGPGSKLIKVSICVLPPLSPPAPGTTQRALLVGSIRFSRKIHDLMQAEIECEGGDKSLYRGPMPRIKGVND